MKRKAALFISTILVFCLAACGADNNGGNQNNAENTPAVSSEPPVENIPVEGTEEALGQSVLPEEGDGNTVISATADAHNSQTLYLWEEGALDLARAVRFVRRNAEVYGIDENNIAVMGFSARGILAGEMLLNFDGLVNGTALDAGYIPDALDEISADAAADGMIYSFYGRLSISNNDVQTLQNGELPPTFYCYGTRDPFYSQFLENADAVEAAGVRVERLQLDGRPHGFGYREDWFDSYDSFLADVFSGQ